MADFFFSRYHITTDTNNLDKAEYLLNGIDSGGEIVYRKDNFKFVYSEILKVGDKIYLVGVLAKYKPSDEQEIVRENEIERLQVTNKVLARVKFVIDPASSIIIHEQSRSHIPKDSFAKRFIELFQKNYEGQALDLNISPITETYTFSERIKTLTAVKKIVINLVPSNPNNADIWEETDNRLRNNHITNYKEVQENKREGESIIIDENTASKFYMSEDGYGTSTAYGIDQAGKPITISTKNSNIWAKVEVANDIVELRAIIEKCQEKLNDIISRTHES